MGSSLRNLSLKSPPLREDAKPRIDARAAFVRLNYDEKSGKAL